MKSLLFFSRVMAVLCTAMLAMPLWADWTKDEVDIDLETHYVGEELEVPIEGWSEKVLSSDAVSQDWDVAFAFSGYDPERSGYYMGSICCLSEGSTVISISEMDFEKEYEIQYNFSITVSGNRFVAPCYRDPDCYWNCAVAPNSAAVLDTTVEVNGHMDKNVRSLCYVSQAYRKYEPDEFYREYSQVPLVSVTTSDPDIPTN